MPRVLVVDDQKDVRAMVAIVLRVNHFDVVEAESGERALELLEKFAFDVVITDLRLPGIDGTQVIEAARERYPSIVAVVITGYGTVKDAVAAIKRRAATRVSPH